MNTEHENNKSSKMKNDDSFISFGWPNVSELLHKKIITDIAIIRAELEYNFNDANGKKTYCNIEKNISVLDGAYHVQDISSREEYFIGDVQLIPSLIRNHKFNKEIFVTKINDRLACIIYCSTSKIEHMKKVVDSKLSKLIKMQIDAKSESASVDPKTVEEMLKFINTDCL